MTYTLAITTYNRFDLLLESFADIIHDPRIDEVLIVDDCSELKYWNKIKELPVFNPKIKVIRQAANRGMMQNKADAIALALNEWVIIFDSDNVLKSDFLDAFEASTIKQGEGPYGHTIYCPSFAAPNFDYRKFSDKWVSKTMNNPTLKEFINDDMGNCALNTCNYVVNKNDYLDVYRHNPEMKGTDTIYFAYLWLKKGRAFEIVPNMTYYHRVHESSGFLQDCSYNMKKAEEIKQLILTL